MILLNFSKQVVFALTLAGLCTACSPEVQRLGQSILSSAGVGGGGSSGSIFSALEAGAKGLSGMSPEEEYNLGRAVSARILGISPLAEKPGVNTYMNKVGMVLAGMSARPETFGGYHFAALQSSAPNAVSAPGGFVFVSTGLLKLLKDEDMLAAVLAHEIGHVVLGHGTKAVSASNLRKAAVALGSEAVQQYGRAEIAAAVSTLDESVNDITKTLFESGYSRGQEYDADEFAVELLARTGYDPRAMVDVLKALQANKSQGGWFSTHPTPEDRLDEVADALEDLGPVSGGRSRQARAARSQGLLH